MSSIIQNKLSHYEVPPPPRSWDKIAAALDNNIASFPEKLFQFEQTPAENTWSKINARLDEEDEQPVKVVPFFKRYSRPLKYSGVAAAILSLAVLTSLLISKKTISEVSPSSIARTSPIKKDSTPFLPKKEEPQTDLIASVPVKEIKKQLDDQSSTERLPRMEVEGISSNAIFNFLPEAAPQNEIVSNNIPVDKYMIYTDGSGNAMRLSKKLYDAFECAAKEFACRQKIKSLQNILASSAVTTDFTGVLEMLKNLQENQ